MKASNLGSRPNTEAKLPTEPDHPTLRVARMNTFGELIDSKTSENSVRFIQHTISKTICATHEESLYLMNDWRS